MVETYSGASKRRGSRSAEGVTEPPALKMARSMPPHSASTRRAAAATATESVTSAGTTSIGAPRAVFAVASAFRRSRRLAVIATRAPRSASTPASAAPMPLLAPVSQTRELRREVTENPEPRTSPEPHLRNDGQMVRGHQRQPRPRQPDVDDLDLARVVDVIEVQHRKEAGIGPLRALARQEVAQIDAVQLLAQERGRQAAHPLVEVADHQLGPVDVAIGDDRRQALRLVAPLEQRRAEMNVVEMQRAVIGGDVDALHPPLLAGLPRQVVLEMLRDWQPAHHHVAELMAAQLACRRHHPAHPELRAELLGMAAVVRPGADHFLQRDDVGVDRFQDGGGAFGAGPSVEAAAAMDVVGRDAQRRARPLSHSCLRYDSRGGAP